jgi:hypothetical protein
MKFLLMTLLCLSALGGEEGKVFVQSDPPGAGIFVLANGELKDSGVKTPGLVTLPKGPSTLTLRKSGFEDKDVVVVAGDAIAKPDAVKLVPPTVEVEVTSADPGWRVFVDGKPLRDKTGGVAVTPCTVSMPVGTYNVGWGKEGFADIVERVVVDKSITSIEAKAKPRAGQSALLLLRKEVVPGLYRGSHPHWKSMVELTTDGLVAMLGAEPTGRWVVKGNDLIITWFKYGAEPSSYVSSTGEFSNKAGFSLVPAK